MNNRKKTVTVRTQFESLHQWPTAPEQVSYLRHPHRHIFHVVVTANVTHGDRQVEFHMMLRDSLRVVIELFLKANGAGVYSAGNESTNRLNVISMSCEDMAEKIGMALITAGYNIASVSVGEDDENFGTTHFEE